MLKRLQRLAGLFRKLHPAAISRFVSSISPWLPAIIPCHDAGSLHPDALAFIRLRSSCHAPCKLIVERSRKESDKQALLTLQFELVYNMGGVIQRVQPTQYIPEFDLKGLPVAVPPTFIKPPGDLDTRANAIAMPFAIGRYFILPVFAIKTFVSIE